MHPKLQVLKLQTAGMYKRQITLFFIFLINSSGLSLSGCNEHVDMRLCLANGATVQGHPEAARRWAPADNVMSLLWWPRHRRKMYVRQGLYHPSWERVEVLRSEPKWTSKSGRKTLAQVLSDNMTSRWRIQEAQRFVCADEMRWTKDFNEESQNKEHQWRTAAH